MKKTLAAIAMTAALGAGLGTATAAAAGAPDQPGRQGECVRAGIGTLMELDLLQAAARQQIDYSTLADADEGPIFADLPEGSNLSLGEVVSLHTSNPDLFAWCR